MRTPPPTRRGTPCSWHRVSRNTFPTTPRSPARSCTCWRANPDEGPRLGVAGGAEGAGHAGVGGEAGEGGGGAGRVWVHGIALLELYAGTTSVDDARAVDRSREAERPGRRARGSMRPRTFHLDVGHEPAVSFNFTVLVKVC